MSSGESSGTEEPITLSYISLFNKELSSETKLSILILTNIRFQEVMLSRYPTNHHTAEDLCKPPPIEPNHDSTGSPSHSQPLPINIKHIRLRLIEDLEHRLMYYVALAEPQGKETVINDRYQVYKWEAMARFAKIRSNIHDRDQWKPLDPLTTDPNHPPRPHPQQHEHCQPIVQKLIDEIKREEAALEAKSPHHTLIYPHESDLDGDTIYTKILERFHRRWNPAIDLLDKDTSLNCVLTIPFFDFVYLDDFLVFLRYAAGYFTDRGHLANATDHKQIVAHLTQLTEIIDRLSRDIKPQVSALLIC